jgi:hypothetical protein
MSELSAVADEIRECGERLIGIADSLARLYGDSGKTPKASAPAAQSEAPKPTLEEVRGVLADKSREGHTAAIREIILSHGAERLSDLDPAEFPAVLAEAGELE